MGQAKEYLDDTRGKGNVMKTAWEQQERSPSAGIIVLNLNAWLWISSPPFPQMLILQLGLDTPKCWFWNVSKKGVASPVPAVTDSGDQQ